MVRKFATVLKFAAAAAAGAAVLSLGLAGAQEKCDRAGWISLVNGPQSGLKIYRSGESEPLLGEPLLALCDGDKIIADSATAAVLRINGEKSAVTVDGRSGPYIVPPRASTNVVFRNMLEYFYEQIFPDLQRVTAHARLRGAVPADDPAFAQGRLRFLSPGLVDGHAQVSISERRTGLVLRWGGGASPFVVKVSDPSGKVVYQPSALSSRYADAADVSLTPGKWRLQVGDAAGGTVDGVFTVVAEPAPSPPGWDSQNADESLRVLWLARCLPNSWGFEALQRVGANRGGTVSRGVLFYALAQFSMSPVVAAPQGCEV